MSRRDLLATLAVFATMSLVIVGVVAFARPDRDKYSATDWSPAATSVPSPGSSTTAPDLSGEVGSTAADLDRFVDEALAFIEATRDLAFLERPTVLALSDPDFVVRVESDLEAEFAEDPELVATLNGIYRAFSLIGPDESIDEVYRSFGAAGILGFYDPETDELVVRQGDELSLLTKSTIVHELVHAFDDQHFDLDRPEYDDRVDEIPWTFVAVAEGSASHVESAWADALTADERRALLEEEQDFGDPGMFDDFALAFLLLEFAPYENGEAFIGELERRQGFAAVAEVLTHPPETSEQVIDPTAFAAGEPALSVDAPAADGVIVAEGVAGQVVLDSLFFGTSVDFGTAAQGWGGDYFVIWETADETCLRWDLRADTPTDRSELVVALKRWASATGGGVVSDVDAELLRVERCV